MEFKFIFLWYIYCGEEDGLIYKSNSYERIDLSLILELI